MAAFFVGRLANSPKRGALAGGITLIAGVATYYLLGALAGYVVSAGNVVWIVVAVAAGPVMGFCGAMLGRSLEWRVQLAAAAPSVMLLAEAIFDRRALSWNLQREPQRVSDLMVLLGLAADAIAMPALLARKRIRFRVVYPAVVVAGTIGAGGFWLGFGAPSQSHLRANHGADQSTSSSSRDDELPSAAERLQLGDRVRAPGKQPGRRP